MNTYVITKSVSPEENHAPSHLDPPIWVKLTNTILPEGQAISGLYKDGFVVFESGKMQWRVNAHYTKMIPNTVKSHLACDGDKMSMLEVAPEPEGFVDDKQVIRNIIPMTYPYPPDGKFGADGYYSATGNVGKSNPKASGKSNPLNACGGEFQPMVYLGADGKKGGASQRQLKPCHSGLGTTPSGGTIESGTYICTCNDGKFDCKNKAVGYPSGSYIQADGGGTGSDYISFRQFLNTHASTPSGPANNYYSADGDGKKHPFQNFLDILAPNRTAKGAAKAAEQQSNADLNAAIANALNTQGTGASSRTATDSSKTMLIVGGAVVGVLILAFAIYKMRNKAQ